MGRITALRDDLAYALAAREELRIIAPIPGKQAVGVEVPNPEASLVTLGDITREFPSHAGPLMAWLGLDLGGKPVYIDLSRMPHLLIAGSTGTGKSVCLNSLLASILLRATPNELRMILIDPKKVELNHYESIPHLLTPVVTNMKDAAAVLSNIVREMESRYELMGMARARNLRDWNEARAAGGEPPMPTILVVIDELADLMMVSPAEVEDAIIRLAQKSRAVGIHLVLATQRPSADVITGMIKANVPSRIAFAVSSQVDSRVVLDAGGAETLLGHGDMLFRPVGTSRLQRLQGAYVGEEEIRAITDHWRAQGRPELREELMERPEPVEDPVDAERRRDGRARHRAGGPAGHGLGVAPAAAPRGGLRPGRAARGRDGADGRRVGPRGLEAALRADRGGRPRPGAAPGRALRGGARRGRLTVPAGSARGCGAAERFARVPGLTGAAPGPSPPPCSRSGTHSERPASAEASTSSTARRRPRSVRSTSGRWRRSSSTSCRRPPTSAASSRATPSSSTSTVSSCSTSTRAGSASTTRPTSTPAGPRNSPGSPGSRGGPRHGGPAPRSAATGAGGGPSSSSCGWPSAA